jgi:PHD/YefM family antitoxin component YafN of YafNO toxin-antitoxin module
MMRERISMFSVDHIHPLTEFKRNTSAFRDRLRKTGKPELLTIEGRPDMVIQDARAYQELLSRLDQIEAAEGIRQGLASMDRGEGVSLAAFDKQIRRKYKLPGRKKK